jgi:predicted nucleic acid-binding protein
MILLDTHVVPEPLCQAPAPQVIARLDAQALGALFLSAITVAELQAGIALLPPGRRRSGLQDNLEQRVLPLFAGRVLAFDPACNQPYAELMAQARRAGLAISTADGCIAAIAAAHGLAVATRDTRPFEAAGVGVINPWTCRAVALLSACRIAAPGQARRDTKFKAAPPAQPQAPCRAP